MRVSVISIAVLSSALALAACGEQQPEAEADPVEPQEAVVEAPVPVVAYADLTGDPAAGQTVYTQCRTCHLVAEGRNGVGPSLYGIIGRAAGSVEGFNYSEANKNSGIVWTPEVMFEYLDAPRAYIQGTSMAYPGLKDAQDRADVIAYLETTDD